MARPDMTKPVAPERAPTRRKKAKRTVPEGRVPRLKSAPSTAAPLTAH